MKTTPDYTIQITLPVNVSFNFQEHLNSHIKMYVGSESGKSVLIEQAISLYSDIKFRNGLMDYDKAVSIAELWNKNSMVFTQPKDPENKMAYLTLDYSVCPFDGNQRIKIYGNNDRRANNEVCPNPTLLLTIKFH